MSETLPKPTGLQLTARVLHSLGAVVAQWAVAEKIIAAHVYLLLRLTQNTTLKECGVRREFSRLQPQWKELLTDILAHHTEYLQIGLALAGAAKVLKEDRDSAAHWPASRDDDGPDSPALFVNVSFKDFFDGGRFEKKNFTADDLFQLSERIRCLRDDVSKFEFAISVDLFPSQCKWHGPKPAHPILPTLSFPTIAKPQHPKRSFRG